jgi:anti-anti-sigma factor
MYRAIDKDQMTIFLEDDLVAPNVPKFNEIVSDYYKDFESLDEVVLSLNSVKNIDSIGVTFVISLYKRVIREGLGFVIHDASDNVQQLFKLMKLDDLLE